MNQQQLARNLAMVSFGLGLGGLLAPRKVAECIGIEEGHENTLRLLGARELVSGLGIMQGNSTYFLWSRVGGDVMDLSLLAAALRSRHSNRRRVEGTMVMVAAITVLDIVASLLHSRSPADPSWRDRRPMSERGAISRDDPRASRAYLEDTMRRNRTRNQASVENTNVSAEGHPATPPL